MSSISKMSSISQMSQMSSMSSIATIDRSGVGGTGNHSYIVGMAGSISISNWESGSNLPNSVSIRISLSLTLAEMSSISVMSIGNRSNNSMSSITKMSNSMTCIAKMSNSMTSIDRSRV